MTELRSRLSDHKIYDIGWEEVLQDCGSLKLIHNQFKADNLFQKKYMYRTVEWEAYYVSMEEDRILNRMQVYFKMDPTDTDQNWDIKADAYDQKKAHSFAKSFLQG